MARTRCRSFAATPVLFVAVNSVYGGNVGVGVGVTGTAVGVGVGVGVHPMHGVGVGVVQGGLPETAAPMGTPDSVHSAQIKVAGGSLAYVIVTD